MNSLQNLILEVLNEDRDYWGSIGAGVLPICPKTKRILISFRSAYVFEPHTYGTIGGKLDYDEEKNDLSSVALREFQEETGYSGNIKLIPAYIFRDKNFEYHNFIGVVNDEFNAKIDWETERFEWITFDELIKLSPKHFGLKKLLIDSNSLSIINKILGL